MTDKELQKLTRHDLLELLLETERENEELRDEVEALRENVTDKQLLMDKVGSIAEASLLLNGVFSAAQDAADQYVLNVKRICQEKEEAMRQADEVLQKARLDAQQIEADTAARCQRMVEQAKQEVNNYWNTLHARLGEVTAAETVDGVAEWSE